jgi:hypothetical protein
MARRGTSLVLAIAALALVPASASAAGEVSSPSWSCYGNGICGMSYTVAGTANHRVFYLNTPGAVTSPTLYSGAQGNCQAGQPDGNPNQFECFIQGSGAASGMRITAWWHASGLNTAAHLQLFTNTTGTPPYNGPFDVPPAQTTSTQRTDENIFDLILAKAPHTPTGFVGHFQHMTSQGLLPDVGWDEELDFPRGFAYEGGMMPSCTWGQVRNGLGCAKARIGTAQITAYVHNCDDSATPGSSAPIVKNFQLFNGGTHEVYGRAGTQLPFTTFELKVNRNHLHTTLTDGAISPSPGVCAPVTDVRFSVPRHKFKLKRHGHTITTTGPFETGPCPTNRTWTFSDTLKFTDGARDKTGALRHNTVETVAKTAHGTCSRR